VNSELTMKAPPFMRVVAASGTAKTFMPIYVKLYFRSAKAVVFPAQGPPVRQIV
jgi:hypothetical protein